ncbi:MAG TPA: tetraacyldisaccharide 4'-kinase [Acidobacteriaceae bacterium]|nr:tetraacyldisaccharide 4'-kinase [Acidobacteriaceae bacterium]
MLAALTPLYAAAVAVKNRTYDRGWMTPKRLRWPVVSIGNLSVGGSGKTPLTIRLAELLRERGVAVDVLSRGYGRRSSAVERVDANGAAEQFGDEPLEIARAAGVPVFVGPSRCAVGGLAENSVAGPGLHLLDDGFQHRQLARDVDIVVLHRGDFSERLLPAGRLRESFVSLRRAQILVLRGEDADLEAALRARGLRQPVWWMERRLEIPVVQRVVAFCAIARPEEFFSGVRSAGVEAAAKRSWRDHHLFSEADIAELVELRRQHDAEGFLTTEKDRVRLGPEAMRTLESAAPVHVGRLTVRLREEAAAMEQLCALLATGGGGLRGGAEGVRK